MQRPLCRELEAARFGDRNEVSKMPQLQISPLPQKHSSSAKRALFARRDLTYRQRVVFESRKVQPHVAIPARKSRPGYRGSRGIGAAIAKRLAADGASVAITYAKDATSAATVVKAIEDAGGKAIAIKADAIDSAAVQSAVEQAVTALGKLDVLVNNAGTAIPKPFVDATLEELDHVLDLNVRSVFVTTQAALKHMNDNGRIIMIGSCVGERNLTPGLAAYAATKGAVKMFAQSLSREVGSRGITVNNVQPGPIDTDLNPRRGRLGDPAKSSHGTQPLRQRRRGRRPGRLRRQPGVVLHYRGKPNRRRRHQRLNNDPRGHGKARIENKAAVPDPR